MSSIVTLKSSDLNQIVARDQAQADDPEVADKFLDLWRNLWSKRDTAWHLENPVHPVLLKYIPKLLEGKGKENPARILLPLCGKSNDLKFLYQEGHRVLGVECADEAIHDFFHMNDFQSEVQMIQATRKRTLAKIHSTPDQNLRIVQNNFLTLDTNVLNGTIDCVWDRGAFGTITEVEQELYIQTIRRLLAPDFRYLLLVLEFDQSKSKDEVPMPQPEEKIRRMFGDFCQVEKLESKVPNHVGLYQKHMGNPIDVKECVYFMTPKQK